MCPKPPEGGFYYTQDRMTTSKINKKLKFLKGVLNGKICGLCFALFAFGYV